MFQVRGMRERSRLLHCPPCSYGVALPVSHVTRTPATENGARPLDIHPDARCRSVADYISGLFKVLRLIFVVANRPGFLFVSCPPPIMRGALCAESRAVGLCSS